jgi:hypothetical protein
MTTYIGVACKNCKEKERYIKNHRCIACMAAVAANRAEKTKIWEAAKKQRTLYISDKPCPRCGGVERYIKSKKCTACRKSLSFSLDNKVAYDARIVAQKAGELTYIGLPCKRCENKIRSTRINRCVNCFDCNTEKKIKYIYAIKTPEERWAELKPRFFDVKTDDEFKGRGFWV